MKLEWEVKPLGTSFNGSGTGRSAAWQDTTTAGASLNELVSGLTAATPYHWRVRVRYHPAGSPFAQYSRWVTQPWGGAQETRLRTRPGLGIPFTDTPLSVGITPVRAMHIAELRARIDEQRVRFGLATYPWTDATLTSGGPVLIKAVHVTEMRTALGQAYIAHGQSPPIFTDPGLAPGTTAKATHITELRAAVITLELS